MATERFTVTESPEDVDDEEETSKEKVEDYVNIVMLLALYTIYGISEGLVHTYPVLLAGKVTYEEQTIFGLMSLPGGFKILWAPLVDSLFFRRIGRRKSWILPCLVILTLLMFGLSLVADKVLGTATEKPQVLLLTLHSTAIILVSTTFEISVDGWSLTLLSKKRLHYAAITMNVGYILGVSVSSVVFVSLQSVNFGNKWLRSLPKSYAVMSLRDYALICAVSFFAVACCIIFKREKTPVEFEEGKRSRVIVAAYKEAWGLLRLRPMQLMCIILLTTDLAHSATMNMSDLKLAEYNIKPENLAAVKAPMTILRILFPWILGKIVHRNYLRIYWYSYIAVLVTNLGAMGIVLWTKSLNLKVGEEASTTFYVVLALGSLPVEMAYFTSTLLLWEFLTYVSDPLYGGTYLTLFVTTSNLGYFWSKTLVLYLASHLSFSWCKSDMFFCTSVPQEGVKGWNSTDTQYNNSDVVHVESYYVLVVLGVFVGVIWWAKVRRVIMKLDRLPRNAWVNRRDAQKLT